MPLADLQSTSRSDAMKAAGRGGVNTQTQDHQAVTVVSACLPDVRSSEHLKGGEIEPSRRPIRLQGVGASFTGNPICGAVSSEPARSGLDIGGLMSKQLRIPRRLLLLIVALPFLVFGAPSAQAERVRAATSP